MSIRSSGRPRSQESPRYIYSTVCMRMIRHSRDLAALVAGPLPTLHSNAVFCWLLFDTEKTALRLPRLPELLMLTSNIIDAPKTTPKPSATTSKHDARMSDS